MKKSWAHPKSNRNDGRFGLCASLLLHAALVLLLCSSSSLAPTAGSETRLDIFWVSPSSPKLSAAASAAMPQAPPPVVPTAQGGEAEDAPDPAPERSQEGGQGELATMGIALRSAAEPEPAAASTEAAASRATGEKLKSRVPPPGTVASRAEARPGDAVLKAATSCNNGHNATGHKMREEVAVITSGSRYPRLVPREPPQESEKATSPKHEREARDPSTKGRKNAAQAKGLPPREPAALKAAPGRLAVLQPSAAVAPTVSPGEPPAGQEREKVQPPSRSGKEAVPREPPPPAREKENRNRQPEKEQPPETRGVVIASLRGDLKMVIQGGSGIGLQVAFREWESSRRKIMPTRAEARRLQRIVPVFARSKEETMEAVVEKAREGVYIFSAVSERGEPQQGAFTLKIYEGSGREKTFRLTPRTVSAKAVLTRILMPDGVSWDDDAAFTGSLQDSESTTKFNAETGLYWKEYDN